MCDQLNKWTTVQQFKEHIIQTVVNNQGVYLLQQHCTLSDRISGRPLSFNMPIENFLKVCSYSRVVNSWVNEWTYSYTHATTYQAFLARQGQ